RQAVGELRDDHDEDQVEEQLEESHPPVGRPVLVPTRGLPQSPEDGRLRHGLESSSLGRPRVRRNAFEMPSLERLEATIAEATRDVEHSLAARSGLPASRASGMGGGEEAAPNR